MVLWGEATGIEKLFRLEGGLTSEFFISDANQVVYLEFLPSRWERFSRRIFRPRPRHVLQDPNLGRIGLDRYLPWRLRKPFVVRDLNNRGCIVGYAVKGDRACLAVLLEPIEANWKP
jgi:hypothetical protein